MVGSSSVGMGPSPTSAQHREHLNIIHPDEGKRYKLNVRTPVGRLTVGKVKQCLAAASSCPIPLEDMILHLNGVPLSNDRDVCESLGIGNGATLSVEARSDAAQPPPPQASPQEHNDVIHTSNLSGLRARSRSHVADGNATASSPAAASRTSQPPFPMSEQRRLLELQTLQQQDEMLHKDVVVRSDVLRHTLDHVEDEMDQAGLRRRRLERQREVAEEELKRVREKEAETAKERERLAALRAQESLRASERAAQLAARREQLRAEQEATRAVALLKLENEKKKATLAQQRALLEAERQRALLEQDTYEASTKARELQLRSREIDMEHQRLARIREARELDLDRRLALQQRLKYYEQLGIEPPRALQREAAALLMKAGEDVGSSEEEEEGEERESAPAAQAPVRHADKLKTSTVKNGEARTAAHQGNAAEGLVQSRGPSHAPSHPLHKPAVQPSLLKHVPSSRATSATSITRDTTPSQARGEEGVTAAVSEGGYYDARENAEANLQRLGEDLGVPDGLHFDDADTCVISIDGEYTLLVTYDAATERLYLYSTLLATLPPVVQDTSEGRLKLYEFLLEASLLGREMCGGGVGASMRNNFVLMSASLYMPTSQPWALRTLAPQFLHCLQHWRGKLTEFLRHLEREQDVYAALQRGPEQGGSRGQSTAPPPPQQQQSTYPAYNPNSDHRVPLSVPRETPIRSHVHTPASAHRAAVTPPSASTAYRSHHSEGLSGTPKAIPVLGLEVTGTVLINGVPTHYHNGVLVVNAAGPAVLAGIQPNDFVEELNEVPIQSVGDFRRVIAEQLVPGMLVPVRINRGGVAMIVTVRVEAAWSL